MFLDVKTFIFFSVFLRTQKFYNFSLQYLKVNSCLLISAYIKQILFKSHGKEMDTYGLLSPFSYYLFTIQAYNPPQYPILPLCLRYVIMTLISLTFIAYPETVDAISTTILRHVFSVGICERIFLRFLSDKTFIQVVPLAYFDSNYLNLYFQRHQS